MDQPTPQGAWDLAVLGPAIGAFVDRELNKPVQIDPNSQYGMDGQGRLYTIGQPAGQVVAQTSMGGKPVNSQLLLLILIGAFIASRQ